MKKTLSSCLVVLLAFVMLLSLNVFAASPVSGSGASEAPFVILKTDTIKGYFHDSNYHLYCLNKTTFSKSYVRGENLDTGAPDEANDYTVRISEVNAVGGEYVIIENWGFWTGIDMDHVAPKKDSDPTARVVGGNLIMIGDGMQFVEGVTRDGENAVTDNVLNVEEADDIIYVKGKFSSITGKVVPAGDLTAAGSPLIVGDEDNPYSIVITSGHAQISGYFKDLEVKAGAYVTITDDTYIKGETGLTLNGTLYVSEDTTLCVNSVSVTPKTQLKFTTKAPWGILPKGTYTAAAGDWELGGDVTVENAFCKLDEISESLYLDQSGKTGDTADDIAKKESYTLTVLNGTVKAIHGNIAAEGGKAELILAPVIDNEKDVHNVVYASGDFKSINFGEDKTLTVPAGKAISSYVSGTQYGVTPDQDTVFDHFGGKLPVAPAEATPYTYSNVYGPWEIEATEGDVVTGAGADLNVTQKGVKVSGVFNSLNTNGNPVTLAGDTVIKGGECEIVGNAADPYELTVEDGTVTVSGSLHKLTVKGGNVTDGTANALTIVSNATAVDVSGGSLTFQNKNTSINVDGSNNVIAANITGGDFYQLKGKIAAQGHTSETIYVTGEGRYHLGDVDNTEGFSSKDTPNVQVYGNTSSCVYVQNGGEAWLHAGEISFMSADSYGIWVNNGGIVHVYPNDQYGSDIEADEALLYVHGDGKGKAAMWVDALGTFDIRGRGALLEQPAEGGHALFIAENAELSIDEPLAGGTFNGLVEYKNKNLADLVPYNHYLRFDGDTPIWGTTDGTFGICPTEVFSTFGLYGSCNTLYPELYADPSYSDMFGELGNYYTVTDAEWELRWNMKNGKDYQIPAGLGVNSVALVLDTNVYNAETVKGETYYPLWGIDHKQGDLNVTGTSSLYLAGRVLTYDGFNRAHQALSEIDTAYADYDGDAYTVKVEDSGALTVIDAVKDAEGMALAPESFLGSGTIFYEPDTAGETAAICSSGELKLVSGEFAAFAGPESNGILLEDGTAIFGLNDEDFSTESIRILGGIVDKDEAKLSQAVKVLGGTLTVNGATIGVTDPDPEFGRDECGGENGMTVKDGLVTVNGGIITGNWAQGKGIEVDGGKLVVHGGCIYGKYQAATSRADMSVYVNGGSAVLNIDEAHKQFTFEAQEAGLTSNVHHLNNVRITTGSLIVGADEEGKDITITPYTYLNGTLTAEGGRTVFYDGVVKETTTVYGAETGTDFVTEFYVENGSFGFLTIANADGNTGSYNYLSKDVYSEDFQNKVQIHGGTYYGIDVYSLKLKNKTSTVSNVIAAWTKAYDFDGDGKNDWAPFNHYAEIVSSTRGADGFWSDVDLLQSGEFSNGSIVGGTDGKAVVIRYAPDEFVRWAKSSGVNVDEYVLGVNIWYGDRPDSLCSIFECEGTESTAGPLVITDYIAKLNLNGFGVFADRAEPMILVQGGHLTVNAGATGSGAYTNVIRNFSTETGAIGIDVVSGNLNLTGIAYTYPTVSAVTAVRSAGTIELEQAILRADYNEKCNAALSCTAGTVHIGDAELRGTVVGALVSGGNVKIDHTDAKLSSLKLSDNATAEITAGTVEGKTEISGTATISGGAFADIEQKAGTVAISGNANIDSYTETAGVLTVSGNPTIGALDKNGGSAVLTGGTLTSIQTNDTKLADIIRASVTCNPSQNLSFANDSYLLLNNTELKAAVYQIDDEGTESTLDAPFIIKPTDDSPIPPTPPAPPAPPASPVISGGSSTPTYEIAIADDIEKGEVTAEKEKAEAGAVISLVVKAEKGYTIETLTVLDEDENEIELTNNEDGTYTFDMPASKVTVKATFMEDNSMLNFFVDVNKDDYYYDAVLWAAENGITTGIDETHFGPKGVTTRAAMVTFLWRAAGCPEPETTECTFTDVDVNAYYGKAVLWAVEKGITKGTSTTTFSPFDEVTRAQAVTFLARMAGIKDDDNGYQNNFTDVDADDYFYNSVAWAAANGITDGTSETEFSPDNDCLRCQIVTFLYRYFVK